MIAFEGHLRLRAEARSNGRTALVRQSFRAPLHVSKPYWDPDTATLLVQVVNPTAGILAGDELDAEISAGPDARLLVTTPSASRVFMMKEGRAQCRQRFRVAARGWLEIFPEALVPHRGARYHQTTHIEIEPGGGLFFVDQLLPGRLGHGEAWSWSDLRLELTVRHGDTLVLHERFAPTGAALEAMALFAGSGPQACFANAVLWPPPGAPDAAWRSELASLHREGTWFGVSALPGGGWTLKMVAPNPLRLRDTLHDLRHRLAAHVPALRCELRRF